MTIRGAKGGHRGSPRRRERSWDGAEVFEVDGDFTAR